jgi:hypothetical protein
MLDSFAVVAVVHMCGEIRLLSRAPSMASSTACQCCFKFDRAAAAVYALIRCREAPVNHGSKCGSTSNRCCCCYFRHVQSAASTRHQERVTQSLPLLLCLIRLCCRCFCLQLLHVQSDASVNQGISGGPMLDPFARL